MKMAIRMFFYFLIPGLWPLHAKQEVPRETHFEISFPASASPSPITGRVFLILSRKGETEPRLQLDFDGPQLFGTDVHGMRPGQTALIKDTTQGFPLQSLKEIPPGDYYVQAILNVYTEFHRADGHTVWAHMDQWEGQDFARSPGNLISEVQKIHFDAKGDSKFTLRLTNAIPPIQMPADTEWVKHIKLQSQLLTQFWGHPMYLGATVLLPKGYDTHPNIHCPVIYLQGHFALGAPFSFTTKPDKPGYKSWARLREEARAKHLNIVEPPEFQSDDEEDDGSMADLESGYEFFQAWNSENFPRMIAVTFQHPTPYFDDSYAINSANAGPYGDAITNELIPYIEDHFRVLRQPYARVLTGGSTGGWGALALQVYHPDFFGGTWSISPDPVDFRRYYGGVNLYQDHNAFMASADDAWLRPERYCCRFSDGQVRLSNRQMSQRGVILGTQDMGIEWLNYTPVASDGYPRRVWNLQTGEIDQEVVEYMRAHDYDLRDYLERNWSKIGSRLVGKIHVICGDSDGVYSNLAVYSLEDFLENTKEPYYAGSFTYGRPLKGHQWQPWTNADLVRIMAKTIASHAPGFDSSAWNY